MSQRTALTRVEVVLVIVIVALLLSILIPSLSRARELQRRERCASNLKGIATGMYSGPGNQDEWPMPEWRDEAHSPVEYTQAIGSYRTTDLSTGAVVPERLSTTRGMWTLVRSGASTPPSFNCPSTGDSPSPAPDPVTSFDFGEGAITGPASTTQAAQFWHQVSYGFQVPFGKFGQPSSDRDHAMVLMADKGPFGANVDAGFAAPPAYPATGDPSDWRPWNSPNHGGLGQTVLYADSHAEFLRTPLTLANSDNIYTRWTAVANEVSARSHGRAPAPGLKLVPASHTDSLIYP